MTLGKVELKVLHVIYDNPGVYISQICRTLNNQDLHTCKTCVDYLNQVRKQRTFSTTHNCWPRLGTVKKAVSRLRKKGLARGDRVRIADPRMIRGWDWVVRLYATV